VTCIVVALLLLLLLLLLLKGGDSCVLLGIKRINDDLFGAFDLGPTEGTTPAPALGVLQPWINSF
jgi:hypothetical protein